MLLFGHILHTYDAGQSQRKSWILRIFLLSRNGPDFFKNSTALYIQMRRESAIDFKAIAFVENILKYKGCFRMIFQSSINQPHEI